jgi:hypothetical protein
VGGEYRGDEVNECIKKNECLCVVMCVKGVGRFPFSALKAQRPGS